MSPLTVNGLDHPVQEHLVLGEASMPGGKEVKSLEIWSRWEKSGGRVAGKPILLLELWICGGWFVLAKGM